LVRDNLPDEKLVIELERCRGNGKDDFPVRAMWREVIAGVMFQHESIESLIYFIPFPSLLRVETEWHPYSQ